VWQYDGYGDLQLPLGQLEVEVIMGAGTGLVIFAVGAIMRFAVTVTTQGFNIHTIGVILMIVGGIGFLLSLFFWNSWGGFGGSSTRRQTTVDGPSGMTRTTTEEHLS
jgi:hypothetical protein